MVVGQSIPGTCGVWVIDFGIFTGQYTEDGHVFYAKA